MTKFNIDDFIKFYDQLSDSGLTWGDYAEQLTYLIFLKMDYEYTQKPFNKVSKIPPKYNWGKLVSKSGKKLETHYKETLEKLGEQSGLIEKIFKKSRNDFKNPSTLELLIGKIKKIEYWTGLETKEKGLLFETVLEKHARTMKTDSAEFPTPVLLAKTIIKALNIRPNKTIHDPACGTGIFFITFHNYIINNFNLDELQKNKLKSGTFSGTDISDRQVRFCLMNFILHGITNDEKIIESADSLFKENPPKFDFVLVDPPFGKKSGSKKNETYERQDFWKTTADKHLNFVQHVNTLLRIDGKAAIIVPDSVLFGKLGEKVRENLLMHCNFHTLLRLPTGILHKPKSLASVLFFDRKKGRIDGKPWTEKIWVYDLRAENHFTPKKNPIQESDFDDFIKCYNAKNIQNRKKSERFKSFAYETIKQRENFDMNFDTWIEDAETKKLKKLPPPKILADEILVNLESTITSMKKLVCDLA
jgi:type I restriction enzyme M protein